MLWVAYGQGLPRCVATKHRAGQGHLGRSTYLPQAPQIAGLAHAGPQFSAQLYPY